MPRHLRRKREIHELLLDELMFAQQQGKVDDQQERTGDFERVCDSDEDLGLSKDFGVRVL